MGFLEVHGRSALDSDKVEVLHVFQAGNQVQVSFSGHDPQNATADIVGARSGNHYGMFLHFWLTVEEAGILMRYEQPLATQRAYQNALSEAQDYLAAMGYLVENKDFEKLNLMDQGDLLEHLAIFGSAKSAAPTAPTDPISENLELSTAMLVDSSDVVPRIPSRTLEESWQVLVKYLASF